MRIFLCLLVIIFGILSNPVRAASIPLVSGAQDVPSLQSYLNNLINQINTINGGDITNIPGGTNGQIQYNNSGSFGGYTSVPITNGGTAATTAQGALNSLNNTPIGNAGYEVVPCNGGGDESNFFNAADAARGSNKGSLLYRDGCTLDNAWKVRSQTSVDIFGFGGGPNEGNTVRSWSPTMYYYIPGVFANAAAQTSIDMNGADQFILNGVNFYAASQTNADPYSGTAMIGNSTQPFEAPNSGTLTVINSSVGGGNTFAGCPVDENFNCIVAGGIKTGTITNGGSGYVNGTYGATGVCIPLTGGTGVNACATSIVVSGGAVTQVNLYQQFIRPLPGSGYVMNDVLGISNSQLGGSGSGFQFTVNTVYQAGYSSATFFPFFLHSFFSNGAGCYLCNNFSDAKIIGNTFTGGQAMQTIFGGGGDEVYDNRFEDMSYAVDIGGGNGGITTGGDIGLSNFNNNHWTLNSFGGGFDARFGQGGGYNINDNLWDAQAAPTGSTYSLTLGGFNPLSQVNVNSNMWANQSSARNYCIDIKGGSTVNYINMQGNSCNGTGIVANVKYEIIPAQFVEDFVGPFGRHVEMGRSWGINIGTTASTLNVGGNVTIGTGSSYVGVGTTIGIAAPLNGAIIEGSVGIGTNAPLSKLDVLGGVAIGTQYAGVNAAPTSGLLVQGNVGIGTTSAIGQFHLGNAAAHSGQATCWTTNGQIGYCTSVVGAGGACTCTGL